MNSFIDLATSRYSVRSFSNQEVEDEKIALILKAGQIAPTACNNQPQKIYVIKSKEALAKLQKCKTSHFNEQVAFLITYDKNSCYVRDYDGKNSGDIDCAIVATHMMLQAKDINVGSTWIMNFMADVICQEFSLPDNIIPVALLVMGYESEDVKINPRHYQKKNIDDLTIKL